MTIWLNILAIIGLFLQQFDWIRFELEQRTNQGGRTITTNSLIYFAENSDLVIHQTNPMNMYILNNRDGELKIFNPDENSVFQTMNYNLNSENNQFYYFLMNKTDDMGLQQLGFDLIESRLEGGLLISLYDTTPRVKEYFDKVELVHKGRTPIFIGYLDKKDKYIKKVFYYDYENISGIDFPMAITEINYIGKNDSIIAKSSFSNFRINNTLDKEMLNFQIPENATLIE